MIDPDLRKPLEHELKFVLSATRISPVEALLRSTCRPDEEHAGNTVVTMYFDTPDLDLLGEKLNSDHSKTKVRARWYRSLDGADSASAAFLEMKFRVGRQRRKLRIELPHSAAWLESAPLEHPELSKIPRRLPLEARTEGRGLLPFLVLAYRRHRYVEPLSGSRVSLDTQIRTLRLRRSLGLAFDPRPITSGVVEVKNSAGEIPEILKWLLPLGARLDSYSKYAAAFATVNAA